MVGVGDEPRFQILLNRNPDEAVQLTHVDEQHHEFSTNGRDQTPNTPLRTTTDLNVSVRLAGTQDPLPAAFIKTEILAVAVTNADPDGGITLSQRSAIADATEVATQAVGLWFEQSYSSDLTQRSVGAMAPTTNPSQNDVLSGYDQTLNLAQLSIPAQPLGVGAQWTSLANAERAGLPISVETTATITNIGPDLTVADVDIVATFIPGDFDFAGQPAQVIEGQLHLSGTMSWSSLSPVALYELTGHSELHIRLDDEEAGKTDIIQTIAQAYFLTIG